MGRSPIRTSGVSAVRLTACASTSFGNFPSLHVEQHSFHLVHSDPMDRWYALEYALFASTFVLWTLIAVMFIGLASGLEWLLHRAVSPRIQTWQRRRENRQRVQEEEDESEAVGTAEK